MSLFSRLVNLACAALLFSPLAYGLAHQAAQMI